MARATSVKEKNDVPKRTSKTDIAKTKALTKEERIERIKMARQIYKSVKFVFQKKYSKFVCFWSRMFSQICKSVKFVNASRNKQRLWDLSLFYSLWIYLGKKRSNRIYKFAILIYQKSVNFVFEIKLKKWNIGKNNFSATCPGLKRQRRWWDRSRRGKTKIRRPETTSLGPPRPEPRMPELFRSALPSFRMSKNTFQK